MISTRCIAYLPHCWEYHFFVSAFTSLNSPWLDRTAMAALLVLRLPGAARVRGPAPIFSTALARPWTSNIRRQLSSAAAATSIQPETPSSESVPVNHAQDNAPTDPEWARRVLQDAVAATSPRLNWTKEEVAAIYHHPLLDLTYQAVSCPKRR